jgi:spermidine synthase
MLPLPGQVRGAALTGMVNLVAAAVVAAFLLRSQLSRVARHGATAALLTATVLGMLIVRSANREVTARQRLYTDPVVAAERPAY